MNYKTTCVSFSLIFTLFTTNITAASWQLGMLAESSRSPFIGDSGEVNTIPLINYIGDRFSFIGGKVQYKLSSQVGYESYIIGQVRTHQFYSATLDNDEPAIEGMKDRKSAFEFGAGLNHQTSWGQFGVEGLIDITGVHQGFELTAKYSYPKQFGRWLIEPALGLQMQSSNLVDYYHGAMESEAQVDRSAYKGDQVINTLSSLMVGYNVNANMLAIAGMEQVALGTGITDSPIISMTQVRKVYFTLIYSF